MEDKPQTPGQKRFMNYFLTGCTIAGVAIAVYLIKNPRIIHPKKPVEYENCISIPDINNDRIPELQVKYKNNSLDTLLSQIKNNEIIYKP